MDLELAMGASWKLAKTVVGFDTAVKGLQARKSKMVDNQSQRLANGLIHGGKRWIHKTANKGVFSKLTKTEIKCR